MPNIDAILSMFGGNQKTPQSAPDVSSMTGPLQGPGGGIDDLIPAHVVPEGGQPAPGAPPTAALSPGEFVWPAATVAYMGDGDSNFGADLLNKIKTDPGLLDKIKELVRGGKK